MPEEKAASVTSGNETNGDAVNGKEKAEENAVSFHKLFAFADSLDKILMIIGSIGAVGNGLCLPLMTVLFGELVDSFGQNQTKGVVAVVSKVTVLDLFHQHQQQHLLILYCSYHSVQVSLKFVYLALGCGAAAFLRKRIELDFDTQINYWCSAD